MAAALAAAVLACGAAPVYAARDLDADLRNEQASEDSLFDRMGDWFATLGKSEDEKQRILANRRMRRSIDRAGENIERSTERLGDSAQRAADRTGDAIQRESRELSRELD